MLYNLTIDIDDGKIVSLFFIGIRSLRLDALQLSF